MRNTLKFLTAGTLMACAALAQEQSASVQNILKELSSYTGQPVVAEPSVPATQDRPVAAPVAVAAPAVEPEPSAITTVDKSFRGWKFWGKADKKTDVSANPVTPPDTVQSDTSQTPVGEARADGRKDIPVAVIEALNVPATLNASRELYTSGEFDVAQRGFEAVIKKDPENSIARLYLRKLLERDARITEEAAMRGVTAAWNTALVLRSYTISSDVAAKMGLGKLTDSADVTKKFSQVDFPKGASAVYQPKTEQLFVRNTAQNLTVLEEILSAMGVAAFAGSVDQVEIEAKFVEVSEGTLEELGFEWRSTGTAAIKAGISDVTIPAGQYLFDDALRGGPGNINGPMPFSRPDTLGAGELSAGSGEWRAFRFEDTFSAAPDSIKVSHTGSNPFDVLITALDQSTGTDMLSAPRIVTESGEKATIRVGEIHYFPDVYEVGGSEGTIIHTEYTDFTERLLGVELNVTPKVDGEQIALSLNPKVYELQGWQTHQIAEANSSYGTWQGAIRLIYFHDPVVGRLPIFKRREIKTDVTIADGATMGMGGLISERIEKYEDKVPVLGSIPLIGRLFRNEGERAVKRNLMIFVTAKKVGPSGRISTSRSFE